MEREPPAALPLILAGQARLRAGVAELVENHARPQHALDLVANSADLTAGRAEVTLGAAQLEAVLAGARVERVVYRG